MHTHTHPQPARSQALGARGGGPGEEAGLLVEVRLGLLTLDGCVETVDVFLRMEPLCVLTCVMGLQTDRTWGGHSPNEQHNLPAVGALSWGSPGV